MAVVKELYIGATHVIVRDDSCCAPEEVEKILLRLSEQISNSIFVNSDSNDKTA